MVEEGGTFPGVGVVGGRGEGLARGLNCGIPGIPGIGGTPGIVGIPGIPGIAGIDGIPGIAGIDGTPGIAGL